jgi:Fe2+ transport system protein FeoA
MSIKKGQKYNITILESCTNKKLTALGFIPNAVVTKKCYN